MRCTFSFDGKGLKQIFELLLVVFFRLVLIGALLLVVKSFSSNSFERGKVAPLERGFWYYQNDNSKFRMQFFCLAVIFVLFDLEVVLFLPLLLAGVGGVLPLVYVLLFVGATLALESWWGKLLWFSCHSSIISILVL